MNIDFNDLTPTQRYFAMTQLVIPRPIAWVLSDNGDNSINLAPYSFFTAICSDPPLILFSAGKKPNGDEQGVVKDTRKNILERKHFVIHIANEQMLQQVNDSAATLNHGVSEVDLLDLDTVAMSGSTLPRLAACDIAMACRLHRIDEVGNNAQAVIYGEVTAVYINDAVLDQTHPNRLVVDPGRVRPLARLGGNHYAGLGELLSANRPK